MKMFCSLLTITLVVTLVGCGPSEQSAADAVAPTSSDEDHDHEEHGHDHEGHDHDAHHEGGHHESLGEAIEHIKEMGSKISSAFAAGKPDDAHDELHEIGHMIESLPELAKKKGLSSEQLVEVQEATEALMDAFGELDGTLHGGDAVEVDDVSEKISAQIEKLQSMQ